MKTKYKLLAIAAILLIGVSYHYFTTYTSLNICENEIEEIHEEEEEEAKMEMTMGRFDQEWLMTHDPETATIPRGRLYKAYKIAQKRRQQLAQKSGIIPIFWEERGPDNVGGRTRGLLIDANVPGGDRVWAAGVSGGLWRCDDIDASPPTWVSIDDFFSNMAINTIAQDPSNTNNLYFGTGEWGVYTAGVLGMGVWRSTDGGNNWAKMTSIFASSDPCINKMLVDNTGTIYAATDAGLFQYDAVNDDWILFLGNGAGSLGNNVQDLEIATDGTIYAAIQGDGIYRFQGGMWGILSDATLPSNGFSRIEITTSPSSPNVIYAAMETGGNCMGVFSSGDSGDSWTARTCPMNLGPFCWYAFIMAVDPNDPARIWLGDVNLFVSPDAGDNWTQVVSHGHVDHHAMAYRNGDSDMLVLGNDGGVYLSDDASAAVPTFNDKNNGYNVTQFYTNALHPDAGEDYYLGGTQDNGTQRFTCAGICSTDTPTGNDGAFCFIDQDNPDIQITGSQRRVFFISTNGGGSFGNLLGGNSNALFITPADYDSANDILYFSDGQDTLGRISDVGGTNTPTFEVVNQLGGGRASTITVSPNTANRIFVGSQNGQILQIDNADMVGAMAVTTLTTPFSTFVSCIDVEVGNDMHLLATTSNYGEISIYESTDGGTTWENVEGNLPDMPVRWCLFHPFDPNQSLIATELGVWTTDEMDGEDTEWFPTNTYGLANVRTDMLQFRPSDNLLVAATHGRGMFSTDYFNTLEGCVTDMMLGGAIAPGIYMAEDFITSDGTVAAGNSVIFHAGNCITLEENFTASAGSYFVAAIQPCGPGTGSKDKNKSTNSNSSPSMKSTYTHSLEPNLTCTPNPVSYEMSISIELPKDNWYQLYVKDMQGKLIASIANGGTASGGNEMFELNTTSFEQGMYVLVLQTQKGAVSEKFIVVR